MKKIAVLILVLAMSFAFANSAKAWFWSSDELSISNFGSVFTDTYTKADSGDNSIGGKYVWGGVIETGKAVAGAIVGNDVNSTVIPSCDCYDDITIKNWGSAFTDTYTKADSGDNSIGGYKVGGFWSGDIKIDTGAAEAASIIDNTVNFTMVGYTLN